MRMKKDWKRMTIIRWSIITQSPPTMVSMYKVLTVRRMERGLGDAQF